MSVPPSRAVELSAFSGCRVRAVDATVTVRQTTRCGLHSHTRSLSRTIIINLPAASRAPVPTG
jgi:hypothetical protein